MRSLPLRLSSVDGESLLGYIARYSHTYQFEPGDVVRALGLEPAAGGVLAGARHGVSLSAEQLEHAAFATGILTEVLKGMLLCRYAGRAFDQVPGGAAERQVWIWCSRFCPPCLCEDGAWRLAWQLGWTTVCVRHQVPASRPLPAMRTRARRGAQAAHRPPRADPRHRARARRRAGCSRPSPPS